MDAVDRLIHAEFVQHIILPEDVRAFIHPRVDPIAPMIWRTPDELAEIEALRAEGRESC